MNNRWIRWIVRVVLVLSGMGIGAVVAPRLWGLVAEPLGADFMQSRAFIIGGRGVVVLLFGFIGFFLAPMVLRVMDHVAMILERQLSERSVTELFVSGIGMVIGLIIAFLISLPVYNLQIPYISSALGALIYIVLAIVGFRLASAKRDEILGKVKEVGSRPSTKKDHTKKQKPILTQCPKILDTSVIIDGRVKEIAEAGFLEGPLVVSKFVLEELQHIADSADSQRRKRGRRGLDLLEEMRQNKNLHVMISEMDFEDTPEVDAKLLRLTKELEGKIVTNDFNLNKVATLQGLSVLNINDLANAVKTSVLPGDELQIQILREGKEHNQGLGYLEDGTMIVVDQGRAHIGETLPVVVTSSIQTSAGKMIFAKVR